MGVKGLWSLLNLAVDEIKGGQQLSKFLDRKVLIVDVSRWIMEAIFMAKTAGYGPANPNNGRSEADFILLTIYRKIKQLLLLGVHTIVGVFDSLKTTEGKKSGGTFRRFSQELYTKIHAIFGAFGLAVVVAPGEAEEACAALQRFLLRQKIMAVVDSSDGDALYYGAVILIKKLQPFKDPREGSGHVLDLTKRAVKDVAVGEEGGAAAGSDEPRVSAGMAAGMPRSSGGGRASAGMSAAKTPAGAGTTAAFPSTPGGKNKEEVLPVRGSEEYEKLGLAERLRVRKLQRERDEADTEEVRKKDLSSSSRALFPGAETRDSSKDRSPGRASSSPPSVEKLPPGALATKGLLSDGSSSNGIEKIGTTGPSPISSANGTSSTPGWEDHTRTAGAAEDSVGLTKTDPLLFHDLTPEERKKASTCSKALDSWHPESRVMNSTDMVHHRSSCLCVSACDIVCVTDAILFVWYCMQCGVMCQESSVESQESRIGATLKRAVHP